MKIGYKIISLGIGLVIAVTLCVLSVMLVRQNFLATSFETLLADEVDQEVLLANSSVQNLLRTQNDTLLQALDGQLNTARMLLHQDGAPRLGEETVPWNAVNQVSKQSREAQLPRLLLGDRWIGKTDDFAVRSSVVDDLTEMTGTTCTIFQRMNDAGDMLRVATSVKKLDGKRAVGTYIPGDSPVAKTLIGGQTYRGRAFVVNDWYLTVYEPIKASDGRVIGALYVGIRQTGVKSLIDALTQRTVGKTGGVLVLGAEGRDRGEVLIHADPAGVGKLLTGQPLPDGRDIYEEMITQANDAKGRPVGFHYATETSGHALEPYIAAASLFEPWGWTVIVSAPLSDFSERIGHVTSELDEMRFWVLLLSGFFVLVAMAVSLLFSRTLSIPVQAVVTHLEELADGDIRRDPEPKLAKRKDELGALARSAERLIQAQRGKATAARAIAHGDLDTEIRPASDRDELGKALLEMLKNLRALVASIHRSAEDITTSSGQVSAATQALSQGATQQAASLEEITSSLTQIASQTQANAQHAATANRFTADASENATMGNEEMRRMLASMSEISATSRNIATIIKVVDEIAFQTNLLALNAAVEAARAGIHGKGFAVVAEEVRNLAGRSAKAARETAQLIEGSISQVQEGTQLSDRTAAQLVSIAEAVARAAEITEDIASASSQQAEGIGQVNIGLAQIERVTHLNTASAEQTAAAASELDGQARRLREAVSRFHMSERSTRTIVRNTPKRPALPGPVGNDIGNTEAEDGEDPALPNRDDYAAW
ncbi:MAG: methyl-accepting chemotaxis protein [Desulfovibrio sp.]